MAANDLAAMRTPAAGGLGEVVEGGMRGALAFTEPIVEFRAPKVGFSWLAHKNFGLG